MIQRRVGLLAVAFVALWASVGTVSAQYYEEEGFFLFVDAAFTTPRDTEQIVAVTQGGALGGPGASQLSERQLPDWGAEMAGRIGFGYGWANGNRVSLSYWQFDNDEQIAGEGPVNGFSNFTVGPAIYYYGYFGGFGSPGAWDFVTDVDASAIDVSWGRQEEIGDALGLEWSLGIRFATFEETYSGFYDYFDSASGFQGYYSYAASKVNEGQMAGVRLGLRGDYYASDLFSVDSGVSFSLLEGKVESATDLVPIGISNAPFLGSSSFFTEDKDRSGNILDFDVNLVWHFADDRYRIKLGYEHSRWEGISADLARNQVGSFVILPDRDRVVFSGLKIGAEFRF